MNSTFFETIKIDNGEIFNLSYHQQRYESVLKKFAINEFKDLKEFINPPKSGLYKCRLTYDISRNPHYIETEYQEYKKREVNSLKLVFSDSIEYEFKSTCRDNINELYEKRGSCDDILIIKNSFVTDTSIANIAFLDKERWITPKAPLLEGTTRTRLLREEKIFQEDIHVSRLKKFSKVALMNAMIDFDIISQKVKDIFVK